MKKNKMMMSPLLVFTIAVALTGCASRSQLEQDRQQVQDQLLGEISLKADRDRFAELREEIPKNQQQTNDELALYLQLMGQGTEQPGVVRDKFQVLVQKRRLKFREKVSKLREQYKAEETKRRDEFLAEQKSKRNSFISRRNDSKTSRAFFAEQDKMRLAFFAEERERRANFEGEILAQSKDFESYMKERNNEFNEQYRLYSKGYYERKVQKAEAKAVTGQGPGPGSDDFSGMDQVPTTPLGTGD